MQSHLTKHTIYANGGCFHREQTFIHCSNHCCASKEVIFLSHKARIFQYCYKDLLVFPLSIL